MRSNRAVSNKKNRVHKLESRRRVYLAPRQLELELSETIYLLGQYQLGVLDSD